MAKTPAAAPRLKPARPPATPVSPSDETLTELTRVLKSLADENRLRILFMLARRGELHVSAIGDELGQSQPAVSHHLAQLKNAGLVEPRRDGKYNFYALNPGGLSAVVGEMFPAGTPPKLALGGVEITFKRK